MSQRSLNPISGNRFVCPVLSNPSISAVRQPRPELNHRQQKVANRQNLELNFRNKTLLTNRPVTQSAPIPQPQQRATLLPLPPTVEHQQQPNTTSLYDLLNSLNTEGSSLELTLPVIQEGDYDCYQLHVKDALVQVDNEVNINTENSKIELLDLNQPAQSVDQGILTDGEEFIQTSEIQEMSAGARSPDGSPRSYHSMPPSPSSIHSATHGPGTDNSFSALPDMKTTTPPPKSPIAQKSNTTPDHSRWPRGGKNIKMDELPSDKLEQREDSGSEVDSDEESDTEVTEENVRKLLEEKDVDEGMLHQELQSVIESQDVEDAYALTTKRVKMFVRLSHVLDHKCKMSCLTNKFSSLFADGLPDMRSKLSEMNFDVSFLSDLPIWIRWVLIYMCLCFGSDYNGKYITEGLRKTVRKIQTCSTQLEACKVVSYLKSFINNITKAKRGDIMFGEDVLSGNPSTSMAISSPMTDRVRSSPRLDTSNRQSPRAVSTAIAATSSHMSEVRKSSFLEPSKRSSVVTNSSTITTSSPRSDRVRTSSFAEHSKNSYSVATSSPMSDRNRASSFSEFCLPSRPLSTHLSQKKKYSSKTATDTDSDAGSQSDVSTASRRKRRRSNMDKLAQLYPVTSRTSFVNDCGPNDTGRQLPGTSGGAPIRDNRRVAFNDERPPSSASERSYAPDMIDERVFNESDVSFSRTFTSDSRYSNQRLMATIRPNKYVAEATQGVVADIIAKGTETPGMTIKFGDLIKIFVKNVTMLVVGKATFDLNDMVEALTNVRNDLKKMDAIKICISLHSVLQTEDHIATIKWTAILKWVQDISGLLDEEIVRISLKRTLQEQVEPIISEFGEFQKRMEKKMAENHGNLFALFERLSSLNDQCLFMLFGINITKKDSVTLYTDLIVKTILLTWQTKGRIPTLEPGESLNNVFWSLPLAYLTKLRGFGAVKVIEEEVETVCSLDEFMNEGMQIANSN